MISLRPCLSHVKSRARSYVCTVTETIINAFYNKNREAYIRRSMFLMSLTQYNAVDLHSLDKAP